MGAGYFTKDELEILNRLDKIEEEGSEDKNIQDLDAFSNSDNPDIRNKVAELLVGCTPTVGEKILLKLLHDKDEIVRVNACDSLCYCTSDHVIIALKNKAVNDTYLVRGYAVLSLGDIALQLGSPKDKEIRSYLLKAFQKEKSAWVKTHYYSVLYTLGDKNYLQNLLQQLHSRLYRIRMITVRSLETILTDENKDVILCNLAKRLDTEKSLAVLQNIKKIIGQYEQG